MVNFPCFENEIQKSQAKKSQKLKVTQFATNDYFISKNITPIPLCMPEDCFTIGLSGSMDPILSYRKYYINYKKHFTKWTGNGIPYWFNFSDIRKYF